MFEVDNKKFFPMFKNNSNIVYLDNAALTFKPESVINKGSEYYEKYSISTRTSDSKLGISINSKIKEVRNKVSNFINAKDNEIIFSQGTTDSLNQIAMMLSKIIDKGKIILSYFNHSSAIVPFLENFKHKNIEIKYASDENDLLNSIDKKTKIVVIPQKTNNFQIDYNMALIYKKCKENNAILINDAAQAIVHDKVDFSFCDVLAFSANKLYGPTGIGILAIKEELLKKLSPIKFGGGQVQDIYDNFDWNLRELGSKWEPGTPNFAGIIQLGEAISFFNSFDLNEIIAHEKEIANYAYSKLSKLKNIEIASKKGDGIILFNFKNIPSQDVASYLGNRDIYVRSGAFCAYKFKNIDKYSNSYVRVSLAMYNTKKDIDILADTLANGGNFIEII
ncbi:Aminotransferase protein S (nitrogen fixation protein NifS) [Metamycoplasma auris 15026]|uniref:Aminotransferase protein S (Nitrogen fixation protein NifS) n=1 Tax=Metamycoplasma auris 15026 TaxID=1188233 RepID=N9TT28_9BACT|nr:aminotransferase class V-fold PLP-dependent enzyme [Metamycoplasma auris]ENY69309.1 Aminotransferase protein S (nitrogen fixation protein NifS) [Metamycoplasma auris 15026]